MKLNKKLFTLIELIVVIVILGVLAAIVVPNISSWKEEADTTAIQSNLHNLQTSVDFYKNKNLNYPTTNKPTLYKPEPIEFKKLYPEYLRNLPKGSKELKYWIDLHGTVWASSVDAPTGITYSNNFLKWNSVSGADNYDIYKAKENKLTSSVSKGFAAIEKVTELKDSQSESEQLSLPQLESGYVYLVSATDNEGFESPPAGSGYTGYVDLLTPVLNPHSEQIDSGREPVKEPIPPSIKSDLSVLNDGNLSTATGYLSNYKVELTGDVEGRVLNIHARDQSYSSYAVFRFLDESGNSIPFYTISNAYGSTVQFRDLKTYTVSVPANAKVLEFEQKYDCCTVHGMVLYEIWFEEDYKPTSPVSNEAIIPFETKMELSWTNPTDTDFDKVAIYRNGNFITFSQSTAYTDLSLYADTDYLYEIEAWDTSGNRSERKPIQTRTLRPEIVWKGIHANLYDGLNSTYYRIPNSAILTWEGNLTGKTVNVYAKDTSYSAYGRVTVLNASNQAIPFTLPNGSSVNYINIRTLGTYPFVMPENGVSIKFEQLKNGYVVHGFDIYEVSYVK